MIGVLVQIAISWLLLHYIEKTGLNALGITPVSKRLLQLLVGILFAGLLSLINSLSKSYVIGQSWILNDSYSILIFGGALWWCFNSVLFEELIFRGALCYIGFKRFGATPTMLFSSACFGVYHWFSWNVVGDVKMMVITFVMTFLYGWTLAYAYLKTGSIFLGCGLHMGWNAVGLIVFSSGTIGDQLFIPVPGTGQEFTGTNQSIFFFAQFFGIPLCHYLVVRMVLKIKMFTA